MSVITYTPTHPTIKTNNTPVPGPVAVTVFRTALNTYVAGVEDYVQSATAFLEQLQSALGGNGVLSGGGITIGVGLSVDVSAIVALVGTVAGTDASTTIGGLTNNATNDLWFRQDGTFTATVSGVEPSSADGHGDYIRIGQAVTLAGAVTSVTPLDRQWFCLETVRDIIESGRTFTVGDGHQSSLMDDLTIYGSYTIYGKVQVL